MRDTLRLSQSDESRQRAQNEVRCVFKTAELTHQLPPAPYRRLSSADAARAAQVATIKLTVPAPLPSAISHRSVVRTVRRMPVTLRALNEFPKKYQKGDTCPMYSNGETNQCLYEFEYEKKQQDEHPRLYEPSTSRVVKMKKSVTGVWAEFKEIWRIGPSDFPPSLLSSYRAYPVPKNAEDTTQRMPIHTKQGNTIWQLDEDIAPNAPKKKHGVKLPCPNEVNRALIAPPYSPTAIAARSVQRRALINRQLCSCSLAHIESCLSTIGLLLENHQLPSL
jgi:hypothetical protein